MVRFRTLVLIYTVLFFNIDVGAASTFVDSKGGQNQNINVNNLPTSNSALSLPRSLNSHRFLTPQEEYIYTFVNDSTPHFIPFHRGANFSVSVDMSNKKMTKASFTSNDSVVTVEQNFYNKGGGASKENKELKYCRTPAVCESLVSTSCFGINLPYKSTSFLLANGSRTQEEVQEKLRLLQRLHVIPRCWSYIQPFLCAVFLPRCEDGMVDLPSQEMCKLTRGPCRLAEHIIGQIYPLMCEKDIDFPQLCKNDVRDLKFNTSIRCQLPLVDTENTDSWFEGIEGCGLQCKDPVYKDTEHELIHNVIFVVGGICLACSAFTIASFLINWSNCKKYPTVIIFYINLCYAVLCVGFLVQFTPGGRDAIVCRSDGTIRTQEPSSTGNLACVLVFWMIYYSLLAGVLWLAVLAYCWTITWNNSFNTRGGGHARDVIDARAAYFHLLVWSLPLVLTIMCLATAQIDGDSVTGICFVGLTNSLMRSFFVLSPIGIVMVIVAFYLVKGLTMLIKTARGMNNSNVINEKAAATIRETIARFLACMFVTFFSVVVSLCVHFYTYLNEEEWSKSRHQYVLCLIRSRVTGDPEQCPLPSRMGVAGIITQLCAVFLMGITMSSWVWTPNTLAAWRRRISRCRLFRKETGEHLDAKESKMVSKRYYRERRNGRTHDNRHQDPLGVFEYTSIASQEFSSTCAQGVSKFKMVRHRKIIGSFRRNSSNSDMSHRYSKDSCTGRRYSLDSQLSLHMTEQERLAYLAYARLQRRKKKRRRSRAQPWPRPTGLERRGSDTSQNSVLSIPPGVLSAILAAFPDGKINSLLKESLERGLDSASGSQPPMWWEGVDTQDAQRHHSLSQQSLILQNFLRRFHTDSSSEDCGGREVMKGPWVPPPSGQPDTVITMEPTLPDPESSDNETATLNNVPNTRVTQKNASKNPAINCNVNAPKTPAIINNLNAQKTPALNNKNVKPENKNEANNPTFNKNAGKKPALNKNAGNSHVVTRNAEVTLTMDNNEDINKTSVDEGVHEPLLSSRGSDASSKDVPCRLTRSATGNGSMRTSRSQRMEVELRVLPKPPSALSRSSESRIASPAARNNYSNNNAVINSSVESQNVCETVT